MNGASNATQFLDTLKRLREVQVREVQVRERMSQPARLGYLGAISHAFFGDRTIQVNLSPGQRKLRGSL